MLFQPADQTGGAMFRIEADVEFRLSLRRNDIGRRIADINGGNMRCRGVEMRRAAIQFAAIHRCQHRQQAGHRIVRKMRIGDMTLAASHRQMAGQAAAAAILDDIAEQIRVCRLADDAGIGMLAVGARPFHHLHRAVDGIAFLVTSDQKADRPDGGRPEHSLHRADEGGDPALHVSRAAPIETAIDDLSVKSAMRPGGHVAHWHHVGMAGETQVRAAITYTRKQIVDPLRALAKGKPRADKTERRQLALKQVERAALVRRHRRTADQPLRQFDSMRRRQPHQSRRRSLTEVFERVFSSTCLMITAQDSDGPGEPLASGLPGSVPGTTTE